MKTGPRSPSPRRASVTASCRSFRCFTQMLTASLSRPPSKKNAAAYSNLKRSGPKKNELVSWADGEEGVGGAGAEDEAAGA